MRRLLSLLLLVTLLTPALAQTDLGSQTITVQGTAPSESFLLQWRDRSTETQITSLDWGQLSAYSSVVNLSTLLWIDYEGVGDSNDVIALQLQLASALPDGYSASLATKADNGVGITSTDYSLGTTAVNLGSMNLTHGSAGTYYNDGYSNETSTDAHLVFQLSYSDGVQEDVNTTLLTTLIRQ